MIDARSVLLRALPAEEQEGVAAPAPGPVKLRAGALSVYYGAFEAVHRVTLEVPEKRITALIGPSGCGKSTLLRAFNRMNDLIPGAHSRGSLTLDGVEIPGYRNLLELRRRVGMVFQRPHVFPMSILDNVTFGPRLHGAKRSELANIAERSLRDAALWEEVKDRLHAPASGLSGGQQQRLTIARCIAVNPEVILMDEPCSALDPVATAKVEELMTRLAREYTILLVTHSMQQAARVSDYTAFMLMHPEHRYGELVEFGPTKDLFVRPKDSRTEDYVMGRFG